jgi:starch-binding outer membrane protein, SusD/RagB family
MLRFAAPTALSALLLLLSSCEGLESIHQNNPARKNIIAAGKDLKPVLNSGYQDWWLAVHDAIPAISLGVAADAYSLSWDDFGARRLGDEPRREYNNRASESSEYRQIAEGPWFGCLSAVSNANDVLAAMERGISIDNGGGLDRSARAGAHLLRGLSWGYLGLLFDEVILADEQTDLEKMADFSPYREAVQAAVGELDEAIALAALGGGDFIHTAFNGLTLNSAQFIALCNAYAARFLAQWPRTAAENAEVEWAEVLRRAERGLDYDFAPLADGRSWRSYHRYAFAETGEGPFWARVDQRLIAALDPSQPARYPEVQALGEPPLTSPQAQSADQRLLSDFKYFPNQAFPSAGGEWHFSHYQHHRNVTQPGFAGNGANNGPMPVFLAADNALLRAEALLRLNRSAEAVALLNQGPRTTRGGLPALSAAATPPLIEQAIFYERAIELLGTAPLSLFFDRRRLGPRVPHDELDALGGLQIGTPAQLPVPASELRVHGLPPYNFGGEQDPQGIIRRY